LSHGHEHAPRFRAPPLSCDAHFHVFGPAERYPAGGVNEKLRYAPPHAPLDDYLTLAGTMGFERFVFVQPSAYGRDNACMLDAMREVGLARCRGIVDVDENAPDALLATMDASGKPASSSILRASIDRYARSPESSRMPPSPSSTWSISM